jgi:hypothetical protein
MRTFARSFIVVALIALVAICAAPVAVAQGNQTFMQRWYFASDFGQWAVRGQQANTYQWSPGTVCLVSPTGSAGAAFFPFATNAPVEIVDVTGPTTNNEVVTPSAVTNSNAYCTIAVSPGSNHYSFDVVSGTGGLQEVLNNISRTATAPAIVWLDRNWYALANSVPSTTPAAIIAAAKGGVSAILVDDTTAGFTYYVWNGSAYASGTWLNTKPTTAYGAAVGSPTGTSDTGTALTGIVKVTTGTGTTGIVFTETWSTSNQFAYAPTCTVVLLGATAPPTLTVTPTYAGGTHAVLTVTVASAMASTTPYSFQWSCY